MEKVNEMLLMLVRKKEVLKESNNITDQIRILNEIIDIYKELCDSSYSSGDRSSQVSYLQKATNLRVLLTQLELQNEALISRMKGIIND